MPVRRVGLYVPGGLVAYPSRVVMNVVPAQVAGVGSLAVASPPQRDNGGLPHPVVLAACALLGVDEVHAVGGAQAVAMFAYGTADCRAHRPGDGPGQRLRRLGQAVARAASSASTPRPARPRSAILADDTADPRFVAADLVAQAEHDANASCLLVTPDEALLDKVDAELALQVPATRHRERVETALRVPVGVRAGRRPRAGPRRGRRVGGRAPRGGHPRRRGRGPTGSPTPARSSSARGRRCPSATTSPGSNHVLPTGGTARHTGGLSVQSFLRSVHVVEYTRDALAEVAPHVDALGGAEDLAAHVDAVRARIPR